jgi:hypothetical protein
LDLFENALDLYEFWLKGFSVRKKLLIYVIAKPKRSPLPPTNLNLDSLLYFYEPLKTSAADIFCMIKDGANAAAALVFVCSLLFNLQSDFNLIGVNGPLLGLASTLLKQKFPRITH